MWLGRVPLLTVTYAPVLSDLALPAATSSQELRVRLPAQGVSYGTVHMGPGAQGHDTPLEGEDLQKPFPPSPAQRFPMHPNPWSPSAPQRLPQLLVLQRRPRRSQLALRPGQGATWWPSVGPQPGTSCPESAAAATSSPRLLRCPQP